MQFSMLSILNSVCADFSRTRNRMYPATRMHHFPHGEVAREARWTIKLSEQSSDNQLLHVCRELPLCKSVGVADLSSLRLCFCCALPLFF